MTRRRRVLAVLAVLLVLLGGLVWWIWIRPADRAEAPRAGTPRRDAPAAPAATRGEATAADVELAGPLVLAPATVAAAPEAAAGELAGRVLDWGTGAPVPDAEVAIAPEDGAGTSSFTTDKQGRFVVRPPAPGRYRVVSALAAGYLPWAPEPGASPLELVARPGVRIDGIVLYVIPAIDYHGTVVDPDGAPVAGATVVLLGAAAGERAGAPIEDTFTSGADGGFDFHAPDDALLEARKQGFAPGRGRVDAAVTVSRELRITLGARGGAAPADLEISGIVVDTAEAPIAGARVTATPAGHGAPGSLLREGDAITGADGRFTLTGLDPGQYGVRAIAEGRASLAVMTQAGATDVRLELPASARIAGKVVDPGGAAVPAATIAVLQKAGLVQRTVAVASFFDAEGRFVVDGLPEGEYQVVAQAHGYAPSAPVAATAEVGGDDEVTVTVRAGATLVGTMIDEQTKQPLEGGKVTVEGSLGEGSTAVPLVTTAITAADGSFELAGIAPGRRSITAAAYAHHLLLVGPLDIADGARLGPITIELPPTAPGETPRLELAGIGAALRADGDVLVVDRVLPGGGAEQAGLTAGDQVLAVDGAPVTDLGLDGAIQRIRGPVGTQVVLRIARGESQQDVAVTRTKIRA